MCSVCCKSLFFFTKIQLKTTASVSNQIQTSLNYFSQPLSLMKSVRKPVQTLAFYDYHQDQISVLWKCPKNHFRVRSGSLHEQSSTTRCLAIRKKMEDMKAQQRESFIPSGNFLLLYHTYIIANYFFCICSAFGLTLS